MIIDMGPLLRGEVDSISIDFWLTPEPTDGVEFTSDAHVIGLITNNAGYMRLSLKVELPYRTECARCLVEVSGLHRFDFERTLIEQKADEGCDKSPDDGEDFDELEYAIIKNGRLDVDREVLESIILEFPLRFLCSEDCEGLCQVCGTPKRQGCGCSNKYIDPRLAVLARLLEEDEDQKDDGGR
ncbi:MAG TPA: DUF177 domain-containing protein [Clostridiales bacterium]|jgi:uncharacterized protein|nr:DUF177 domain-containing protein [Clostridiales bacterium]